MNALSVILARLLKDRQLRVLTEKVEEILDVGIVEKILRILSKDQLALIFAALSLVEIFSTVKLSLNPIELPNFVRLSVSLLMRIGPEKGTGITRKWVILRE